MNYIYDILINFKYPLYDFYEWNRNDDIKNLKRIPIYKISSNQLIEMKNNRFYLTDLLSNIKNQTLVYTNKKNKTIDYAVIFTDGIEAVGFLFSANGKCIGKSKLLLDEELDIINSLSKIELITVNYTIKEQDIVDNYKTRYELSKKKYLVKAIDKMESSDEVNYLFYECFNRNDVNPKIGLIKALDSDWDNINNKISSFIDLISMKKD